MLETDQCTLMHTACLVIWWVGGLGALVGQSVKLVSRWLYLRDICQSKHAVKECHCQFEWNTLLESNDSEAQRLCDRVTLSPPPSLLLFFFVLIMWKTHSDGFSKQSPNSFWGTEAFCVKSWRAGCGWAGWHGTRAGQGNRMICLVTGCCSFQFPESEREREREWEREWERERET